MTKKEWSEFHKKNWAQLRKDKDRLAKRNAKIAKAQQVIMRDRWQNPKSYLNTQEYKNKISIAGKGAHQNKNSKWNLQGYNEKKSDITKKIWKDKNKRKRITQGIRSWHKKNPKVFAFDKNANWRGGKSFYPYPLGWNNTFKEQIRYRDGYKCQECGKPEIENMQKLDVHHKDRDKNNLEIDNLISLCRSCHAKKKKRRKVKSNA